MSRDTEKALRQIFLKLVFKAYWLSLKLCNFKVLYENAKKYIYSKEMLAIKGL